MSEPDDRDERPSDQDDVNGPLEPSNEEMSRHLGDLADRYRRKAQDEE